MHVVERRHHHLEYEIGKNKIDAEIERFHGALQKSDASCAKLMGKTGRLRGAAAQGTGLPARCAYADR